MSWIYYITATVIGTVVPLYIIKKSKQKQRVCGRDYPKDTVILHQFPRGPYAPSMSPFCVKLETFLRMAKIPYLNIYAYKSGPKGKIPWIEYNGDTLGDSAMIMKYLAEKFELDLNNHLTPEQKGISVALQKMVDEHMYWLVLLERWVYHRHESAKTLSKLPSIVVWEIGRRTKNMAHAQGVGRHTEEEVESFLQEDLTALNDFLGKKEFMLGNEPTEVDCAVFGQLSQVKWHVPDDVKAKKILEDQLPALNEYCERIKSQLWPDWEDCISHGFTTKPKKNPQLQLQVTFSNSTETHK